MSAALAEQATRLIREAEDVIDILRSGEPAVTDRGVYDLLNRLDGAGLPATADEVQKAAIAAGLIEEPTNG